MVEILAVTPPFDDAIKDVVTIDSNCVEVITETDKRFFYHPQNESWERYCYSCERSMSLKEFGEMSENICDGCCWDGLETEAYGESL